MKYVVVLKTSVERQYEVEAESEDSAIEDATDRFYNDDPDCYIDWSSEEIVDSWIDKKE